MNNFKKRFITLAIVSAFQKGYTMEPQDELNLASVPIFPFPVVSQKHRLDFYTLHLYASSDGFNNNSLVWLPQVTYGLTENFGVNVFFPYFISNNAGNMHSSGWSDLFVNVEWVFFNTRENQAMFQGGLVFPTGSTTKLPPTGGGTYNGALKASYFHTSDTWYALFDLNAILTSHKKQIKPGNAYLFNGIFSKVCNIAKTGAKEINIGPGIGFAWTYDRPDMIYGAPDPNTGGHVLFFGPQLLFQYTRDLTIFIGYNPSFGQHLFGSQPNARYLAYFYLEVIF